MVMEGSTSTLAVIQTTAMDTTPVREGDHKEGTQEDGRGHHNGATGIQ
jgi:hypothetical protein